jgi:hypothetical protein
MSFVRHRLSALIQISPEEARRELLEAYRNAGASRRDAAKLLGCDEDTFATWAKRLDLGAQLEALTDAAKLEGWHHGKVGGRPVTTLPPLDPSDPIEDVEAPPIIDVASTDDAWFRRR